MKHFEIVMQLYIFAFIVIHTNTMTKEATSLKLEKPVFERAKEQAKKENRSFNNFIETLLIKYFDEVDKKQNPE